MKLIKNFLPYNTFKDIQKLLFSHSFPWYYSPCVAVRDDKDDPDYFFFHHLFDKVSGVNSSYLAQLVMPILGKLEFNDFLRAKINLFPRSKDHIQHKFHTDSDEQHWVALYSVNTNNGYTMFENGKKIKSEENTLCIFDGNLKHCSNTQTDEKIRININLNFK
jgi:hypothetical protein